MALEFDGYYYDHKFDGPRLQKALGKVREVLLTQEWLTVEEVAQKAGLLNHASVSAQIRNLRKKPYRYVIEIRQRGNIRGLYEYKLLGIQTPQQLLAI